jgi:hypothetical protein
MINKGLLTLSLLGYSIFSLAQVGIGTNTPASTLDVRKTVTSATDTTNPTTSADGIRYPNMTKTDLANKSVTAYTASQNGTIVYVTTIGTVITGTSLAQVVNITVPGYYYFDGALWQKITPNVTASNGLSKDVTTGDIQLGGILTKATTVTQNTNTLAFTGTATNAFSVDGTTLSVDAANHKVGIGTITPASTLDIVGQPTNTIILDAVIPPRITGDQLKAKTYTTEQNGAIVYVTVGATGSNISGQTINVLVPGIYSFDGSTLKWIYLGSYPIMTSYLSSTQQGLDISSVSDQVITFAVGDKVADDATTFDDTLDTFTVKSDGIYQISGFIGFNANRTDFTNSTQFVAVNLKIQKTTVADPNTWSDITGIRSVFSGISAGTGTAIQTPTTIVTLKSGEKLRFVIQRPSLTIGSYSNQSFATYTDEPQRHINKPNGQSYTKSITITKVR